jgi:hypothetical protein
MKRFVFGILFFAFVLNQVIGQEDPGKLLSDFQSTDWETVKKAKEKLENMEAVVIPKIIELTIDNNIKKLENTKDLIYPGATKFYGHGQIIDYNIDYISVRAGWLLEDLTFQNFGFKGYHLQDTNEIINHIKTTFPEYSNNVTNRKNLENSDIKALRKTLSKLCLMKVNKWWEEEQDDWNRLDALYSALSSFDEYRQVMALFYIRNGKTSCTGLTKDYYIDNLSREIVRLSGSEVKRISENAKLILLDVKYEWLDLKPVSE